MTKLEPMIAVKDVEVSAAWYSNIFGFNIVHDGVHFSVLTNKDNEIVLCLHAWERDCHPTMRNQSLTAGHGLLLYFRTSDWKKVNLEEIEWTIEEEIHLNKNSRRQEFSFRDPDGYFITVTEFHIYEG